jgi:hypothetical protein
MTGIQQWLSTNPKLDKPELPEFRGSVTIADVCGIDDPVEYGRAVEAWARSAWEAYRDLQPRARVAREVCGAVWYTPVGGREARSARLSRLTSAAKAPAPLTSTASRRYST